MPSEETIELIKLNRTLGRTTNLPDASARSSAIAKLKELLLEAENIPILSILYGAGGTDEILTLNAGEDSIFAIVSDGTFLYCGTVTFPGVIVKVDLATFTRFDAITLNPGEDQIRRLLTDGHHLYVVCLGRFVPFEAATVVRINLQTFQRVDSIDFATIPGYVSNALSATLDGTYLYVGLNTFPGQIVQIDTRTFTVSGLLTLNPGENTVRDLVTNGHNLYACTIDSPGVLVQIDLNTFTETTAITLDPGEDSECMFLHGDILYVGCFSFPAIVVKVDLETFSRIDAITMGLGEDVAVNMFVDGTFVYVSLATFPIGVAVIDISMFEEVHLFTFPLAANIAALTFVDQLFLYIGVRSAPGQVIRRFIFPTNNDTTRRIIHIDAATDPHSTYILRPENTTGIMLTSGGGVYNKGVYTEILAAGAITRRFYLHAIFLDGGAMGINYEVDVATGLAGSETIIATITHSMNGMEYMEMPCISIPANTRLSARCSDSAGGNTLLTKIRYRLSTGG
jgi:hypothetical protein